MELFKIKSFIINNERIWNKILPHHHNNPPFPQHCPNPSNALPHTTNSSSQFLS